MNATSSTTTPKMQIGIFSGAAGASGLTALMDDVHRAADTGFHTYWLPQIVGRAEAMNLIGVLGSQVPGIRFGTSVIPTYPRHPMVMAEQALTTSMLTDNRFTLGIGLSHQIVVEGMWGLSYDKPLRHAREYLDALLPLLAGEQVSVSGDTITARGKIEIDAVAPPVYVAALGPQMLKLTGTRADGTITWMTGAATIASLTAPTINAAAESASRPAP